MLENLIRKNRSFRRFYQNRPVDVSTLKDLVNLARLSASAANRQPLKYILSNQAAQNEKIFSCLSWAAYLKDWPGPGEDEKPAAYIVILGDTTISTNFWCDHGIAAQSILLGAREKGLAGCILGAIRKKRLRVNINIPEHLDILLVLAIGVPREDVTIEPLGRDNDIRYWRDKNGVHHVPKRSLDDIILNPHGGNKKPATTKDES